MANEPPSGAKEEPPPPWQRYLQGEDATRAKEFAQQVTVCTQADDYAAAILAAQELLDLRKRLQGADHWEAVNAVWQIEALQKIAKLSAEDRESWRHAGAGGAEAQRMEQIGRYREAFSQQQALLEQCRNVLSEDHPDTASAYNNLAANLYWQSKFSDAARHYQTALGISRRILGEDHPDTASSYSNLAANLNAQSRYTEAVPFHTNALDIRRRVLGEDHADTASSYNNLALTLNAEGEYGEAESLYRTALGIFQRVLGEGDPRTASAYNNLAVNLNAQGRYAEAEPFYQRALDVFRARSEVHPNTASGYSNLAANLNAQARFTEAEPLYKKALDIRLQLLGEDHHSTATSYDNLAANLHAQGRYAEAVSIFAKAFAIRRRVLGKDHRDTATSYNNLAATLHAQGKYAKAEPLYRTALLVSQRALGDDHPFVATSYGNLAANLHAQGKYAEAEPLFQKALDIRQRVLPEDHSDTASSYSNLAVNLNAQRRYVEAAPLYEMALDIHRRASGRDHPNTARSYNNLAGNLNEQGQYAEAEPHYEEALDIRLRALGEEHPDTARSYNNLAGNLNDQGRYAEAAPLFERARSIRCRVLGDTHPDTAHSSISVAVNLFAQEMYADVVTALHDTTKYESARLQVSSRALDRAVFSAERSPYLLLAAAEARDHHPIDAWRALEADLARGLLDESADRASVELTAEEEQQREALLADLIEIEPLVVQLAVGESSDSNDATLASLVARRGVAEASLARLAVALSKRQVSPLEDIQAALPVDAGLIAWIDVSSGGGGVQEHWGCVIRANQSPTLVRLPGTGPDSAWRKEDSSLPAELRKALAEPSALADVRKFFDRLAAQRIAPLLPHLDGVGRLYVVAAREMAGVPVEVLTDRFIVSYIPSGTQLARLKNQEHPTGVAGLLALGDAVYDRSGRVEAAPAALPPGGLLISQVVPNGNAAQAHLQAGDVLLSYAGSVLTNVDQLGQLIVNHANDPSVTVTVWRETEDQPADRELAPGSLGVVLAREPAPKAIAQRREADLLIAKTRGRDWQDLPGTRVELARLASLFDNGSRTLLADSEASEQRLEELHDSGQLEQFRFIHLATHGEANSRMAFESALILAQDNLPDGDDLAAGAPFYDGRLTANEILAKWRLNAELVTLSACESELGRDGGGEGHLGFAQALLLAGSRSVCLSLWKVDDTATALLMDRFYRNLLGRRAGLAAPLPKAEALAEAKSWLKSLSIDEAAWESAELTRGVARGAGRKVLRLLPAVPAAEDSESLPYAHPAYWAAFVLIGDPQ